MYAQILLLPSGFRSCDFCSLFFSIFVLSYDLIFLEFGLIPGNDFLEISLC
jgi:hypothetical protein